MADKYRGNYPLAWSQAEVDTFLETGKEPPRASNGVWINDDEREERSLSDWSVAELYALYNAEILSDYSVDSPEFIAVLRGKAMEKCQKVEKWSDEEVLNWLMTGDEPERTPSGNFLHDPERFKKDVNLLNDSELIDFGLGYFGDYERGREYVLIEALERFKLDLDTTLEDFAEYCKSNELPARGRNGALINSRTRNERPLTEWSEEEVSDWAISEISGGRHSEADLLKYALEKLVGEWYWSKADLARYLTDNELPDPDKIDISGFGTKQLAELAKSLKHEGIAKAYAVAAMVDARAISPIEFSGNVTFVPEAWSEAELVNYILTDKVPEKANDVLWLNDQHRAARWNATPPSYSNAEVKAVLDGQISIEGLGKIEALKIVLDDAASKHPLISRLYIEEAIPLMADGVEPKWAATDILVRDRIRDSVSRDQWSDQELREELRGNLVVPEGIEPSLEQAVLNRAVEFADYGDEKQRIEWFLNETGPERSASGIVIKDPKRCTETLDNWSDAELKALGLGEVEGPGKISPEMLAERLQTRGLIPEGDWTPKAIKRYLKDGTLPKKAPVAPKAEKSTVGQSSDILANATKDAESVKYFAALWKLPLDSRKEDLEKAFPELQSKLTSTGVLIEDAARDKRIASHWKVEELLAWAKGEISHGSNSSPPQMAAAIRKNWTSIPENWDNDSVVEYIVSGKEPETASTGVLVRDLKRDKTEPSAWTNDDLIAWAKGELVTDADPAFIMLAMNSRFKVPSRYTVQQALDYVVDGKVPEKVVPAFDNAETATDEQLKLWASNKLSGVTAPKEAIFTEIRARMKINPHWTDADIGAFMTSGITPAMTENGLFVNDRERDSNDPSQWSYKEVEALMKGWIKSDSIRKKTPALVDRARYLIRVEQGVAAIARWSDDQVVAFVVDGVKPDVLDGDVYKDDPRRETIDAIQWSNAELKAFLRKEIDATEEAPKEALWDVIYDRFEVPRSWYQEDARSYVLTGKTVPSTPSGIWVRDQERDSREASQWKRTEFKAWARGQIPVGLKASEEDLLDHACIAFNISTQLSAQKIKSLISAITEDSTPMSVKFVTEDMLAFIEGMKKEGGNEAKAAGYQQLFNNCIIRVTKLRGKDFVDGWTTLLKMIHDHRSSVFSARKQYDGVGSMNISKRAMEHFQFMTSVLTSTCDPATRDAAVQRINWTEALKGLNDEEARQQILAYYGIGMQ